MHHILGRILERNQGVLADARRDAKILDSVDPVGDHQADIKQAGIVEIKTVKVEDEEKRRDETIEQKQGSLKREKPEREERRHRRSKRAKQELKHEYMDSSDTDDSAILKKE